MQRVFRKLTDEGFIVSRGWEGTFVSERPPHLNDLALVFPYKDRPERQWPEFWRALEREAVTLAANKGHELHVSYGNETREDREAYLGLEEDVAAHRVAGLIFPSPPAYLGGSPVLQAPDIPRVAISPEPMPPNVKAVSLSGDVFNAAVQYLLGQGRRRIAWITVPAARQYAVDALQQAQLGVPPYWVQTSVYEDPEGARRAVQLLMAGRGTGRPDGLVIFDDNLVESATAGLIDAGIRVPDDLMVVAHCNFPRPTRSHVPARRLGYDVRAVLKTCVDLIDAQRRGEPVPDVTGMPLVWDDSPAAGTGSRRQRGRGTGRR